MDNETEESTENSSSDEDDPNYPKLEEPKFNRAELKAVILRHGGTVMETFPGTRARVPANLVVLTDRACRTMTFLLAVAHGFPRINFQWVLHSAKRGKLEEIRSYFVPVGYSTVHDREVEQHSNASKLTDMLKGMDTIGYLLSGLC